MSTALGRILSASGSSASSVYAVRTFSTGSHVVRAAAAPTSRNQPKKTVVKKSSGWSANKTSKTKARRGADSGLMKGLDSGLFRKRHPPAPLPDMNTLTVSPLLRNSAVGYSTKKGSLVEVFGIPKTLAKENIHLVQPFSVIRETSLESFRLMDAAAKSGSKDARYVLTGPTGTGKSITLLQVAHYCAAQKWVVLYVPQAIDWVTSSSPYQYDPQTRMFNQPALASKTLNQLSRFNASILETLKLEEELTIGAQKLAQGTPLSALAAIGVQDPSLASTVLTALFEQLGKQTEYPVLVAIDDVQALYCQSNYRDPLFHYVKSYHLSMPRAILEYASGIKTFARGAVVGALSTTNTSYQTPIELKDALGLAPSTSATVWAKRNPDLVAYTAGLKTIAVPDAFNVHEAAAMIQQWDINEAIHTTLTDSAFMAKLAESSGNPRDFLHKGFLDTIVSY